jgi:hypothetical protein
VRKSADFSIFASFEPTRREAGEGLKIPDEGHLVEAAAAVGNFQTAECGSSKLAWLAASD